MTYLVSPPLHGRSVSTPEEYQTQIPMCHRHVPPSGPVLKPLKNGVVKQGRPSRGLLYTVCLSAGHVWPDWKLVLVVVPVLHTCFP